MCIAPSMAQNNVKYVQNNIHNIQNKVKYVQSNIHNIQNNVKYVHSPYSHSLSQNLTLTSPMFSESHPDFNIGCTITYTKFKLNIRIMSQLAFTCSKLTIETLEQGVNNVQS